MWADQAWGRYWGWDAKETGALVATPEPYVELCELLAIRIESAGYKVSVEHDVKATIGKRYARMDEAGCPYCFTVDGQTLTDQTVTVRDRDSGQQQRIGIDKVSGFLLDKLGG